LAGPARFPNLSVEILELFEQIFHRLSLLFSRLPQPRRPERPARPALGGVGFGFLPLHADVHGEFGQALLLTLATLISTKVPDSPDKARPRSCASGSIPAHWTARSRSGDLAAGLLDRLQIYAVRVCRTSCSSRYTVWARSPCRVSITCLRDSSAWISSFSLVISAISLSSLAFSSLRLSSGDRSFLTPPPGFPQRSEGEAELMAYTRGEVS